MQRLALLMRSLSSTFFSGSNSSLAFKATYSNQRVLAHTLKVAILTSYKNLSVGYNELKLHIYALGTSETYFTSCKKGHNRSPLKQLKGQHATVKLLEKEPCAENNASTRLLSSPVPVTSDLVNTVLNEL